MLGHVRTLLTLEDDILLDDVEGAGEDDGEEECKASDVEVALGVEELDELAAGLGAERQLGGELARLAQAVLLLRFEQAADGINEQNTNKDERDLHTIEDL